MLRIPYLREAGALIAAALVAYALWTAYNFAYNNGYNAANVRAEKIIAEFAKAEADAQARARKAEQAKAKAVTRIAAEHEAELDEIQANADRLAADLLAGSEWLRDHWQGCIATSRVSGDATAARLADEAARVRAESAARIIAAADQADAQVRGLQRYAREVSK